MTDFVNTIYSLNHVQLEFQKIAGLKIVSTIFYQIFIFHQMTALQKL